jgi:uncharacterized membrane protein (DUF485 family)
MLVVEQKGILQFILALVVLALGVEDLMRLRSQHLGSQVQSSGVGVGMVFQVAQLLTVLLRLTSSQSTLP